MRRKASPAGRLRLAILNDSPHVLKLLCDWFRQHGHQCATRMVAEMSQAHVEVQQFINEHKPDVVVYDLPMPYASSWDLLDVIRATPSLQSQPFVFSMSGNVHVLSNSALPGP